MKRVRNIYALYNGDEFVVSGTLDEIAEYQGVNKKTIAFYGTPSYKKRNIDGYLLIKLGTDEEICKIS